MRELCITGVKFGKETNMVALLFVVKLKEGNGLAVHSPEAHNIWSCDCKVKIIGLSGKLYSVVLWCGRLTGSETAQPRLRSFQPIL
jgi:hypothetical protein